MVNGRSTGKVEVLPLEAGHIFGSDTHVLLSLVTRSGFVPKVGFPGPFRNRRATIGTGRPPVGDVVK